MIELTGFCERHDKATKLLGNDNRNEYPNQKLANETLFSLFYGFCGFLISIL